MDLTSKTVVRGLGHPERSLLDDVLLEICGLSSTSCHASLFLSMFWKQPSRFGRTSFSATMAGQVNTSMNPNSILACPFWFKPSMCGVQGTPLFFSSLTCRLNSSATESANLQHTGHGLTGLEISAQWTTMDTIWFLRFLLAQHSYVVRPLNILSKLATRLKCRAMSVFNIALITTFRVAFTAGKGRFASATAR